MKEIDQYRAELLENLLSTAQEFRQACLAVQDPLQPVEANGWTVQQIAAHVRDVDRLAYGLRARRTLTEDNPEFENFDGEAYARQHAARAEPLPQILAELMASLTELSAQLHPLPSAAWSRISHHEKLGSNLTLQLWVERSLGHIEEHLATVRRAR